MGGIGGCGTKTFIAGTSRFCQFTLIVKSISKKQQLTRRSSIDSRSLCARYFSLSRKPLPEAQENIYLRAIDSSRGDSELRSNNDEYGRLQCWRYCSLFVQASSTISETLSRELIKTTTARSLAWVHCLPGFQMLNRSLIAHCSTGVSLSISYKNRESINLRKSVPDLSTLAFRMRDPEESSLRIQSVWYTTHSRGTEVATNSKEKSGAS